MTAPPQVITRSLTFNFAPSISGSGLPNIMEVAVIPLDNASSAGAGATFAGGLRTASVTLSSPGPNTAVFDLIPTFAPGLSDPIKYRVMWRAGVQARTFTYDFNMPDADLTWEQLTSELGNIIDGESYLQQADLGVPNRVARLNSQGIPIDSAGNPVATSSNIAALQNALTTEIANRAAGDASLRNTLEAEITTQVDSTLDTARAYTDTKSSALVSSVGVETAARIGADNDLQSQITSGIGDLQDQIDSVAASTGGNTDALDHKADLDDDGKIPVEQIPDEIRIDAFPVANQAAMLALDPEMVHRGSLAVRPDGVFLLTTPDPSQLSNWVSLSTVSSVNTKRGAVTLTASDVNAIPVGGAIAQSQVTGLSTALGLKANSSDLSTVAGQVQTILSDSTIVRTSAGVIDHNLNDSFMVYLNGSGQLVKKNGDIIPVGGGGGAVFSVNGQTGLVVLTAASVGAIATGASIAQSQVTGLSTTLAGKADLSGGTVPTGQIPDLAQSKITGLTTALSAKADLSGGTIPLGQIPVMSNTKITGLTALIAGNQLTSTSNAIDRIATLEGQIVGGGGGGGGVSSVVPFYTSSEIEDPVIDFNDVVLHSPWGIDSDGSITGTVGTWYYLYDGVRSTDVAYPYISPNGHLRLHKWNEAGPADPVYALQSDLTSLTTTVSGKASQADLTSLTNTVTLKADQSTVTALSSTVDGKANTADLTALANSVALKANQSALDTTNSNLALKANQSALDSLTTTVGTKANQSALDTTNTTVAAHTAALPTKADLVSGTVPTAQIPSLAQSKITGLTTSLAGKADLDGSSKVLLTQIPTNIPQSSISGLGTALGSKADLVGGVVPASQLPAAALPNVVSVANRAALLALTSAQVQYGDLGLITGGEDKGTYVLTGSDPSNFANWTLISQSNAPVTSVNGQLGTVVLTYTDVGALAANASIPISQVTSLQTQLDAKYATATATAALALKADTSAVQTMFYTSSMVKRADYVTTAPVASLAGQQSIDGVLVPVGAVVLLTAQSSSVNNGLWTVASGPWTRPADFATASLLARDSIIIVSNKSASANGTANNNTIWQATSNNGFIGTDANNWSKIGNTAPQFAPVAGNGIDITGTYPALTLAAKVNAGAGLVNTSSGLAIDPNVGVKKFLGTVPSGSTVAGITHGLNTTSPVVQIWEVASNTMVLAGVTVTSANAISIEFASAPASGQYRVCILG